MTKKFKKGDIIQGSKRNKSEAYHPIIYFGEIDIDFFHGGMITHSNMSDNMELYDIHFDIKISHDGRPSFFVKNYLIKKQEWGPFRLIGKLSSEGIKYIEENISSTSPELWEDYLS